MEGAPPTGSHVQLAQPLYGYEEGACAVVISTHPDRLGRILVRFDQTGHSIAVELSALSPRDK